MANNGMLGHIVGMLGNIAGDISGLVVGLAMTSGSLNAETARIPLAVTQGFGWVVIIFAALGLVSALLVAVRNFTK